MSNKTSKIKAKEIVKTLLILAVLVVSYVISVITSSFYETNKKLVVLLICFVAGVLLFVIVYVILYLLTFIKIKKRAKRLLKESISCDDRAYAFFEKNGYSFSYNVKESFSKNMLAFKDDALSIIKEIANVYGVGEDKFYYLGYTVYDATNVLYSALDLVDVKISPIFKLLKAEDKPLGLIENLLEKAVESDGKSEEKNEEESKPSFLKKIGLGLLKATTFIFRGKIENALTDVVKFAGVKAFEVYGKNGKEDKGGDNND